MPPNDYAQPPPKAGAQRRPEAVGCSALLDSRWFGLKTRLMRVNRQTVVTVSHDAMKLLASFFSRVNVNDH